MGQINTNNYPTVNSLADADLLIVENATNGTGTTTPKQLRENAIGTGTLQTSAQTVIGAVNELKGEIDAGAGVVCYDVNTITSGYLGGQFSGSANLLLLHLTTDGTADATNGYMMMLSYSRPVARFAYGRLVDSDGVAYKQDVYADNTIICKISNSGEGTESDPVQVVILGIINAGFMLTPTAVVSDRDIIDGQGNTLSVLAEALTKTASGNPVVITDCAGGKARSLITEINAIQDLHGYDYPWAGGAGKNLLPMTVDGIKALNTSGVWSGNTYTINGGTFQIVTDNDGNVTSVKANGTFTATSVFIFINSNDMTTNFAKAILGQTIVLNGCPARTGNPYVLMFNTWGTTSVIYDNGTDLAQLSVPSTINGYRCDIQMYAGTISNVTFHPMIRTSGDASFAPYSNICPISGRDSVVVDDTGKNLLECKCATFTSYGVTFTNNGDGSFKLNGISTGNFSIRLDQSVHNGSDNLKAYEAGSYTLSGASSKFYTNIMQLGTWVKLLDFGFNATNTATATQALNNCFIIIGINSGTSFNNETFKIMIERGTTATDYEPYAHSSATIQLGTTVYGADINWDTGVGTVKTQRIAFDGSEAWTASNGSVTACMRVESPVISDAEKNSANNHLMGLISNMFKEKTPDQTYVGGESNIGFSMGRDGKISVCQTGSKNMVVADWKTWLATNPLQVEYKLATPTTIQLTPEQLEMLKGYNRVTIEDGSIELGYIAKLT